MYKLLIVDDEPLMQVGIKSMINCDELDVNIVGLASNGEIALHIIEEEKPDIVICDIKMPIMTGLELIKICTEKYGYCNPVFIFLTSYEEFSMAKEAVKYQASDYLIKIELTPTMLSDAINKAKTLVKDNNSSRENKLDVFNSFQKNEDKFYMRLLQNMFEDKEHFELQRSFLQIEFNAAAYQCIYLEFFEQTNNSLKAQKKFALYLSSATLLSELLSKYIKAKVISLDVKHCAVIISLQKENDTLVPALDKLIDIFSQLNESIQNYYNTNFRAGIGGICENPLDICVSYQQSRLAFSLTNDIEKIKSIKDISSNEKNHTIFNLSLFKDNLSQALDEFDEMKFKKVIDDIALIFNEHPTHTSQAMDAACNILYTVISGIPDGEQTVADMFSDYPDHYRSIYRLNTVEQIIKWLQIFSDKLGVYFSDRKNNHTNYTVNTVKQYINSHVTEKLTLNDVAALINITPNYLSQLFKKHNDCGFNEYVTIAKINEAKKMMSEGQLKIYEISDALGFESSFYFSKVFKKIEGCSPKDYINQKLS